MVGAIIAVGTELLTGRVRDENGVYIASKLLQTNLLLNEIRITGDRRGDMKHSLEELVPRCDVLFITGGLGPTEDDITCDIILEHSGSEGELHAPSMERINEFFSLRGMESREGDMKMARVPRGSRVFLMKSDLPVDLRCNSGKPC